MARDGLDRRFGRHGTLKMSPVLRVALARSGVSTAALVELVRDGGGLVEVGDDPRQSDLAATLPAGTSIDAREHSLDMCTAETEGPVRYRYYEADQVPFIDVLGIELPDTVQCTLTGRRLSALSDRFFPALAVIDPPIEWASMMETVGGRLLRVSFDFPWLVLPITTDILEPSRDG